MNKVDSLKQKALEIAMQSHREQVDKAGKPYIFHPIRVAERCINTKEQIVALLHDTIEDSGVTAQQLLNEGFTQEIVDAVLSVTRKEGESYEDFIKRSALNPIGKVVKTHDLEDNLDIKRLDKLEKGFIERFNKYLAAYRYLTGQDETILHG